MASCRLFILAQLDKTPSGNFQAEVVPRDFSKQYAIQYITQGKTNLSNSGLQKGH